MRYVFDGPAAGAEFTWLVELSGGMRVCRRHDVISAEEFAGASPEAKRNIEGLVERGILSEHDDNVTVNPDSSSEVADTSTHDPAAEPGKESS